MKKLFLMILIAALVFCMAACAGTANEVQSVGTGNSAQTGSSSASMDASAPAEEETAFPVEGNSSVEETSEMEAAEEKAPAVYFSATGSTRSAAGELVTLIGADLYEIVLRQLYTGEDLNYNGHSTRAIAGRNGQSTRLVIAGELPDPGGYSMIYVDYPIWWGDMPRILYAFFNVVDFSARTIAPFCTNGDSGLSGMPAVIAALEPDATVAGGSAVCSSDQLIQQLTEIGLA